MCDGEQSTGGQGVAGEGMRIVYVTDVSDESTTSTVDNQQPASEDSCCSDHDHND